uniref:Uncharacterized protein n=1 Tax=Anopheles christyi TaxID=43041 RepID=A0A182JQW0_9DIPT
MVSTIGGPSTVAAAVAAAGAAAAASGAASTISTTDATQLFINTTLASCALRYEDFELPSTVLFVVSLKRFTLRVPNPQFLSATGRGIAGCAGPRQQPI